jgi:hypothetical protein
MRKILMASVFAAVPFGAGAADLYGDYSFIQESAPSYGRSVVGHLELSGGWANYQDDGIDEDVGRFEGRGRANIPFAGNWNLELETGGVALFQDGTSFSTIGVAGHLWAGWGGVRIGGFGGIDFLTGLEVATGGLEAEVDVGNLTFGVQGNYTQQVDDSSNYLWGVRGWADLYVAANTRLGVEGFYADVAGGEFEVWSVWGTAEHRFAGTPLSLFVRGGYGENLDSSEEIVTVLGGIRVFMDGGLTLQEHDQQVPFAFRLPEFINYVPIFDM